MQTNQIPAASPGRPTRAVVTFVAEFPLGTNQVDVAVADGTGNLVTCGTTVKVVDRLPPLIVSATANPNVLWPPNHKLVDVQLRAVLKDFCGSGEWKIVSVTSNEPVNDLGDGNTSLDWEIVGDHDVRLRAERSGKGSSRIYSITLRASDDAGNQSPPKVVLVTVPKSQGKGAGKK